MKELITVIVAMAISSVATADWLFDSVLGEDFDEVAQIRKDTRFRLIDLNEETKEDFGENNKTLSVYIEDSDVKKDEFTIIVIPSTFVMLRAELYLGEEKISKESIALMGHAPILSTVAVTKPISIKEIDSAERAAILEEKEPIRLELREVKTVWK